MRAIYARELPEEERTQLRRSLKSGNGFTVCRAQMILKSADEGLKVDEIGKRLGCTGQTVREAIHAFDREGLNCLEAKKIAGWCETHYIDIAIHNPIGPVATSAFLHLCLSCPNFAVQELPSRPGESLPDVVTHQPVWKEGYLLPPNKPGLGIEFNSEALRKYRQFHVRIHCESGEMR